jgi:hypothetical protein
MCAVHIMCFVQKTSKNYLAAATGQICRQWGERVRSGGGCCGYVRERGCWSCWFIAWNWVRIVVSLCHSPHNKQEQMITFESGLMLFYCQKTFYLFVACVILKKRGLSLLMFRIWTEFKGEYRFHGSAMDTVYETRCLACCYTIEQVLWLFRFSFLCRALEE